MSDQLAEKVHASTQGYLSKEDYVRTREDIEQQQALASLRRKVGGSDGAAGSAAGSEGEGKKRKKGKLPKRPSALSFDDDDGVECDASPPLKPKKMGKCQDVDVSFLKKNEREEEVSRALAQRCDGHDHASAISGRRRRRRRRRLSASCLLDSARRRRRCSRCRTRTDLR